jgi:nitrite reductase/ring-hydroxylating ferredoxin subunit
MATTIEDWIAALPMGDLVDGKPVRVAVGGVDVFICRTGDEIFALDNRCNHMGGPLNRGRVNLSAPATVTCPIHGSMFWLADGRVVRGPATRPQETLEVRLAGDMVEVRSRPAAS